MGNLASCLCNRPKHGQVPTVHLQNDRNLVEERLFYKIQKEIIKGSRRAEHLERILDHETKKNKLFGINIQSFKTKLTEVENINELISEKIAEEKREAFETQAKKLNEQMGVVEWQPDEIHRTPKNRESNEIADLSIEDDDFCNSNVQNYVDDRLQHPSCSYSQHVLKPPIEMSKRARREEIKDDPFLTSKNFQLSQLSLLKYEPCPKVSISASRETSSPSGSLSSTSDKLFWEMGSILKSYDDDFLRLVDQIIYLEESNSQLTNRIKSLNQEREYIGGHSGERDSF